MICVFISSSFFFNDPATTEIYTLSLHDALPIWGSGFELSASYAVPDANILPMGTHLEMMRAIGEVQDAPVIADIDRKSTRLNSSHPSISYAVFCLKKKRDRQLLEHTPADSTRSS